MYYLPLPLLFTSSGIIGLVVFIINYFLTYAPLPSVFGHLEREPTVGCPNLSQDELWSKRLEGLQISSFASFRIDSDSAPDVLVAYTTGKKETKMFSFQLVNRANSYTSLLAFRILVLGKITLVDSPVLIVDSTDYRYESWTYPLSCFASTNS